MRYWKRINAQGETTTVESYSHNLKIKDAIEIDGKEFTIFVTSLPVVKPVPIRDLAAEIDALKAEIEILKTR